MKLKAVSSLSNLEYKAVHRKKYFGILWKFLNPLILILVYVFVFSSLYQSGSRGFMISTGILLFSGISATLNSSTSGSEENAHLLGTISFDLYCIKGVF